MATATRLGGVFQSTHPLRGATFFSLNLHLRPLISIHAPLAGCDSQLRHQPGIEPDFNPRTPCGVRQSVRPFALAAIYFNPRTPCGVRRYSLRTGTTSPCISIHAPLAGCDFGKWQYRCPGVYFNPRTPCGVRQMSCSGNSKSYQFQSTHPLRGATVLDSAGTPQEGISIHAPLAGCDRHHSRWNLRHSISIHAPLAGCDFIRSRLQTSPPISIHAPLAGCDQAVPHRQKRQGISIHAPLAGCDP